MTINKYDLIIFDCDGVLIDSELLGCRIEAESLTEAGFPYTTEEVMEQFTGMKASDVHKVVEAKTGKKIPSDFMEKITKKIRKTFTEELQAVNGIHEALDSIKNIKKCVASGSDIKRLEFTLKLTSLYHHFENAIFSSEQVENGKPFPDVFLFSAKNMNVKPERCAVVEDSIAGVKAGKAAGMDVFGFTGASHCSKGHEQRLIKAGATKTFSNMKELANIL